MIGSGRGSMLIKMLENNNNSIVCEEKPPSTPKPPGRLGSIGRGTSLMTPGQFMKHAPNRSITSVKPILKYDIENSGSDSNSEENLSLGDGISQMKALTLDTVANNTPVENIDLASPPSLREDTEMYSDVNAGANVSNNCKGIVTGFVTHTDVPYLPMTSDRNTESVREDESMPNEASEAMTECAANHNIINGNGPEQRHRLSFGGMQISPNEEKICGVGETTVSVPFEETKEKNTEKSEDVKWKLYQVERKINKIIKDVTAENLSEAFVELECLIEERPLSSRFLDCSEVEILIEVIMKNAVQRTDFLPLAPCLIKMVSEHQPIEFKQYFQEICDTKCKEYVTLSASEEYLNNYGEHFCKLLGHLFALPRQTGPSLFNILINIVGEYVERWSCPEGTELITDGIQEHMLAVYASALKFLLLEITHKMLSCDSEVETEMEKYVWFMRESVLNAKLPRKVREIYLDGIMELQSCNTDRSDTSPHNGTNSQDDSEVEITYVKSNGDSHLNGIDYSHVDKNTVPSQKLKPEISSCEELAKSHNDAIDFARLENPPIDTIAMAPNNAYDSCNIISKASKGDGFRSLAMTFSNESATSNMLKDSEDSDPDIIIEDEYNDSDGNQFEMGKTNDILCSNVCNDNNDYAVKNDHMVGKVTPLPCHSPYGQKKLPLGRGRGLAQLPTDASGNSKNIPIANVVPIGYQYSEDMHKDRSLIPSAFAGELKCGEVRRMDAMRQQECGRSYIPSGGENYQRRGNDTFDNKRDRFHPPNGGRQNNGMSHDNFQSNRNRGFGNENNYPFRNANNTAQNNTNWREKPRFKNNPNHKPKKMKFRPVYHERDNNKEDNHNSPQTGDTMEKFYHPDGRLEYKAKTPEITGGFGSIIPKTCLRCNSHDHLAEDCPNVNMFF